MISTEREITLLHTGLGDGLGHTDIVYCLFHERPGTYL